MSPKAKVLSKHKTAELVRVGNWYVIDAPHRRARALAFLGSGRTPRAAWANAVKHIR